MCICVKSTNQLLNVKVNEVLFVGIALVLVPVLEVEILMWFLCISIRIVFHQYFMLPINIFQVALEELSGNRKISLLLPNLVSFISNQVAFIICFFSRLSGFLDFLTDAEKTEDVAILLYFPKISIGFFVASLG